MLVSLAFYKAYVKLPPNSVPPEIEDNPHYYPFFKGCHGAADGSLLDGFVPMADMWLTCHNIEAGRAVFHKTFLPPVNSTCSSAIFSLAGKGVQQMVGFLRMQGKRGLPYQKDAITSVTQGFPCMITCLFHTEVSIITWMSGIKLETPGVLKESGTPRVELTMLQASQCKRALQPLPCTSL